MPTEPVEIVISAFELGLLLLGAFLLFRLVSQPARRERWLGPRALPPWPVTLAEFLIFVLLIFGGGVFFSVLLSILTRHVVAGADRVPLELIVAGLGLDGGGLVGWWLFHLMHRTWQASAAAGSAPAAPAPEAARPGLPWRKALVLGAGAWVVSLPLIVAINAGWVLLLRALHLPAEPQDLIAIFANAKSPWVVGALLLIACGLAPVYEELLFRAGLYRFCRDHQAGNPALLALPVVAFALVKLKDAFEGMVHLKLRVAGMAGIEGVGLVVMAICLFRLLATSAWMLRHRRIIAVVLCGFAFGALHQNLASFVPLALFGMCLALAYEATGAIAVPIAAHALFNLNTVLIVLAGLS